MLNNVSTDLQPFLNPISEFMEGFAIGCPKTFIFSEILTLPFWEDDGFESQLDTAS